MEGMFSRAMFSSLIWLIAALALTVRAQFEAQNCNQLVFDINSSHAANEIRNCTTLVGLLQIDLQNASGTFHLDNIKTIIGGLVIHSHNLTDEGKAGLRDVKLSMHSLNEVQGRLEASETSNLVFLSMPNLTSIVNQMHLHDLEKLETVNMNKLEMVGTLVLDNLPALKTLEIDAGISQVTGFEEYGGSGWNDPSVVVQNTALSKLESFNFSTVASFKITDNRNLESIVMALTETTRAKSWSMITNNISSNGDSKTILSLPHLWRFDTEYTEFHDLAQIDIPRLRKVWGSLYLGDNSLLTNFNASRLVEITKDLVIEWNPLLSSITFPTLRTVNSLVAQGTKALAQSDGVSFGDLREVKEVYVGGDGSSINCRLWDNMRCTGLINTVYTCGSDWRHRKQVAIAEVPEDCQLLYPVHGWTKAKKTRVRFRVVMSVIAAAAIIFALLRYRRNLREIDYRNALRDVWAGKYMPLDEEEAEAIEMRHVEGRAAEQSGSSSEDKLLPRNGVNGMAGPSPSLST